MKNHKKRDLKEIQELKKSLKKFHKWVDSVLINDERNRKSQKRDNAEKIIWEEEPKKTSQNASKRVRWYNLSMDDIDSE